MPEKVLTEEGLIAATTTSKDDLLDIDEMEVSAEETNEEEKTTFLNLTQDQAKDLQETLNCSLRRVAVLSGARLSGFSALARLYYLARPTKTAMLRRLAQLKKEKKENRRGTTSNQKYKSQDHKRNQNRKRCYNKPRSEEKQ